ncbi:protein kinase family protein [Herbaspirillum robiniae]|uniref:protein kinase family protein n=1 Tax=Herbaspirillum robiniae TaxID=2014887 RepID=UPI0009A25582|nr:protein kinase family protein [Herbaspirillum robiniae]
MAERIVEFLRKKDFVLERELGRGSCGQTVLLFDSTIDERFACKKYAPAFSEYRVSLFQSFVREIKLLHQINHANVVRVFNYYLFPEKFSGYILMEYVEGMDIENYLDAHPEDVNEIFLQVIEGFSHLEEHNILHRDIRPTNILVSNKSVVKIIDFGFGKQAITSDDYAKSISLNWWCDLPLEFKTGVYDFSTEVYFIGKLFEKIILDADIRHFKHEELLGRMCSLSQINRISSFSDIRKQLLSSDFDSADFDHFELKAYREFSSTLTSLVSSIEKSAKYYSDAVEIQTRLENCFKKVMLEEHVPSPPLVVNCFVQGQYRYFQQKNLPVSSLKNFLNLLRSSSREKQNIIVANILTRLDSVSRHDQIIDDDIPF